VWFVAAALSLFMGPALALASAAPVVAAPAVVAFTADTEGHVGPCLECPGHSGLGGLARRATAVARLRAQGPVLLLDAGNALYGPDSIAGNGAVIVAAYNGLAYDAVHLTPRDFRLGKPALADALKAATFDVVSANLLDADSGRPIAKPFVVKDVGGRRVAVIGLSEPPAGMDYLPHLKRQLAGVKIVPPAEALAQTLPKAKAEADDVVLLYYGSAAGAKKVADALGKDVAAVLVGGARPEELPQKTAVPLVASAEHGKSLARLTLGAAGASEQIAIDDSVAPDPKMAAALLAQSTNPAASAQSVGAEPHVAADASDAAEGGVHKLVQADVPPIEPAAEPVEAARPEPAFSEPARSEASASKPTPAEKAGVEPTGASKQAAAPASESPTPAKPPAEPPQRAPAATGPKFCTNCGAKLSPNAKFCTHCGTRVRR
jgi:2',3'-cyclic-nucleotide 2'-phosphodiesterase (5'-nucleotidase family)